MLPCCRQIFCLQLETFRRHETGIPMKPTAEQGVLGKRSGGAGEVCKHNLGDILSQMCISTDQAERGAIDQADIAPDQFPESRLGAVLDVFGEQCLAVCHLQFSSKNPPTIKSRQKFYKSWKPFEDLEPPFVRREGGLGAGKCRTGIIRS